MPGDGFWSEVRVQAGTKETQEAHVACCGGAGITEAVAPETMSHLSLCT